MLERDRHTCAYCGGRATTIDHVVPRSRCGVDSWRNCVASCTRCNGRKGSRLLGELGWTLRVTPAEPRVTGWVVVGVTLRDPSWEPYLVTGPTPAVV